LWATSGQFELAAVCNRDIASSEAAVAFIGAGQAVAKLDDMASPAAYLIATPDDAIVECCAALAAAVPLGGDDLVFHCSGALPSSALSAAREAGAQVASLHPIKSFAEPVGAVASFAGTWCGLEGDEAAVVELSAAVQAIGGQPLRIRLEEKANYHAAGVFVSNYLNVLAELGASSYQRAGLGRLEALAVMAPIMRNALDNILQLDTVAALTGPIARGDLATVEKHLGALGEWSAEAEECYKSLGRVALQLSQAKGEASADALAAIAAALNEQSKQ
jgi:predicted short-subunit dehydrogenase-like oxidoreductase (DUF2520 family)